MSDNMVTVEIELDAELKTSVEMILKDKYGMTLEEACVLFIEECVRSKGAILETLLTDSKEIR